MLGEENEDEFLDPNTNNISQMMADLDAHKVKA